MPSFLSKLQSARSCLAAHSQSGGEHTRSSNMPRHLQAGPTPFGPSPRPLYIARAKTPAARPLCNVCSRNSRCSWSPPLRPSSHFPPDPRPSGRRQASGGRTASKAAAAADLRGSPASELCRGLVRPGCAALPLHVSSQCLLSEERRRFTSVSAPWGRRRAAAAACR